MAVRTIGVNVTGKQSIKDMEKRLDALKKSVLTIEDSVGKWGKAKKGSTPLSFRVEVTLDDTKLKAQLRGLKASLKDLDGYVKVGTGGSSSNNKDGGARRISNALYRDNLQDLQQATRDLQNNLQRASESVRKFTGNLLQFSIKTPAQGLFNAFNSVSRMVINAGRSLETTLRTSITGVLSTAFRHIAYQVQNIFSSVVQETKAIGDALATYRLQMQQLGLDDKQINSQLRNLTEYGKKTVYDASDLIKYAGDYRAYGREDAIEVVKALAGLAAQTVNPNESIDGISRQLSDMLARDKVAWQDVKFMKGWMNASGSKQLQDILDAVAQGKGHKNLIKAIEKNDITPDEFLKAIKDVGLSESFQKLVNSIVTPTQALDNLKENLSNLFIVPDYFDDGSVQEAPLAKLYSSTTEFIKGISAIVDSTRVKNGIRVVGDDLAYVIDTVKSSGAIWNTLFGERFVTSIESFYTAFKEGFGYIDPASANLAEFTEQVILFNQETGQMVGRFTKVFGENLMDFMSALTNASRIGINNGFLDGVNGILELYTNLVNLSSNSGAVATFSKQFSNFFETVNRIVKDSRTVSALKPLVESIDAFVTVLLNSVEDFAVKGGGIRNSASFVTTLFQTLGEMLTEIKLNTGSNGGRTFANVVDALKIVVRGVKDVWVEIISSTLNVAGSEKGRKFFKAVADLVVAVNQAVVKAFRSLGGGSVEMGIEKIIRLITGLAELFTVIANFIGNNPHVALAMVAIPKITKLFMGIKKFLELLNGINFINAGAGLALSKKALTGGSISGGSGLSSALASGGMYTGIKGLFRSLRDTIHIFALEATENGLMSAIKYVFPNAGKYIGNAVGFLGKGIGKGIGIASLASLGINTLVQNSNASDSIKHASSSITSAIGWGTTGATLGSMVGGPAGAMVGGLLGLAWSAVAEFRQQAKSAKIKAEARAQAEQIAREQIKAQNEMALSYAQSLAESSRELANSFRLQLAHAGDALSKVGIADDKVNQSAQYAGQSPYAYSRSQGFGNFNTLQNPIDNLYVEIEGQIVAINKLKEDLNLDSDQLLRALQELGRATGESVITLKDEVGNVVQEIRVFNKEQEAENAKNTAKIASVMDEYNVEIENFENLSIGQIQSIPDALRKVNEQRFAKDSDKKQAIIDAISQGDEKVAEALDKKSLKQLEAYSATLTNVITEYAGTPEEQHAILLEKLAGLGEDVSKYVGYSVEALRAVVATETLKVEGESLAKGVIPNIDSLTEVIDQIKGIPMKATEEIKRKWDQAIINIPIRGFNEVDAVLAQLGITDQNFIKAVHDKILAGETSLQEAVIATAKDFTAEKNKLLAGLKTARDEFIAEIGKKVQEGEISLDQASQVLASIGINIDSSDLSTNARTLQALVASKISEANDSISRAIAGLDSMVATATSTMESRIAQGQRRALEARQRDTVGFSTGGLVPLYRAFGGEINWKKKGTDTVPAMLTPGEYVLRKKAVESLGTTFLNRLNTHGAQALNHTRSVVNNYYNTNNAKINQNIDNKSQYLNGMQGLDRLMRYV